MFFIGLFSSHIVYIILALIYIFGYSTYALNSKEPTPKENIDLKTITYQNPTPENYICTYYFYNNINDCCEISNTNNVILKKHSNEYLYNKLKVFDCKNWTSYNYQLPNIARPSPFSI